VTSRNLRIATGVLGLIGLAIAIYLVYIHYAGLKPFCVGGGGSCERVQSSRWSELAGIPVALLGLFGYVAILITVFLPDELSRLSAAFVSLVGFGFSAWLTFVEITKIHAICQWCVASAVIMTLLAIVSITRLLIVD
jgi:uncharacterized membrane protein